jgi:hypothetical protein
MIESSLSDFIVDEGGFERFGRDPEIGVDTVTVPPMGLAREGLRGVIWALAEVAEVVAVLAVVPVI